LQVEVHFLGGGGIWQPCGWGRRRKKKDPLLFQTGLLKVAASQKGRKEGRKEGRERVPKLEKRVLANQGRDSPIVKHYS
jgi:hypothetical protein